MFRVEGMVVGWMCGRQASVTLLTMEEEFTSASHAGQDLLGLRELLTELEIEVELPMNVEMDNQTAIRQVEKEESLVRAKYIDIETQAH